MKTRAFARIALASVAGALFGCAAPGSVVPQQATASEVHDRVGFPSDIRFDANGNELWEYARGPSGTETYVMRIGKDGRVQEVTQLLTDERFARIQPGSTTKAQVRDWMGRPSDVHYLRSGLFWEWRTRVGPELGHYVVRFDEQGVVSERMVVTDPQTDGGKDGGK